MHPEKTRPQPGWWAGAFLVGFYVGSAYGNLRAVVQGPRRGLVVPVLIGLESGFVQRDRAPTSPAMNHSPFRRGFIRIRGKRSGLQLPQILRKSPERLFDVSSGIERETYGSIFSIFDVRYQDGQQRNVAFELRDSVALAAGGSASEYGQDAL